MAKIVTIIVSILLIILLLVFASSFIANRAFTKSVKAEVALLWNSVEKKNPIIQAEDLAGLPTPVQRWLEISRVVGKERIYTVRMKQQALMRLEEGKPWMPAKAEQYFTVEKPGFIWKAYVQMSPLLHFTGKDKYYQGKGSMQIKALSLIPVVDAHGPEIDQGTLLRYLGEMIWFPTAALSDYLSWEEVDAHSAKVIMNYGGVSASGIYQFNEQGDISSFKAQRYMEKNGQYSLEDWGAVVTSYKEFNGIRIANKGQVIWYLNSGAFTWYQYEILQVDYNNPLVY